MRSVAAPVRKAKRKPAAKPAAVHAALVERASQNTLAANPLVGIRRKDILAATSTLVGRLARQPRAVTGQYAKLVGEYARIAAGRSTLAPAAGDRRFADPAWTDNAMFRRMLQSYVALGKTLDRCVDEAKMDPAATERARFAVSLFVDAIAPTNSIAGNPAALQKLVDTKGASVIRGLRELRRGPRERPRPAPAGRRATVHRRPQCREHAGRGRLPQCARRADPVPADDARRARAAAPDRAAADQQVLRVRSRARQEPRALRARQRRADVRRELAQPDARARGLRARRLRGGARARRSTQCARSPGPATSTCWARARAASRLLHCSAAWRRAASAWCTRPRSPSACSTRRRCATAPPACS